jgi:hypothetical protein
MTRSGFVRGGLNDECIETPEPAHWYCSVSFADTMERRCHFYSLFLNGVSRNTAKFYLPSLWPVSVTQPVFDALKILCHLYHSLREALFVAFAMFGVKEQRWFGVGLEMDGQGE